ncbi:MULTISPECIES: ParA family protein [Rhodococcus]|uniref:Cellulose biosynthesis protein BcsQ n=1 Tax=Rhodococcus koreensis TaxID=99653 RepID=A0A1H4IG39_9NOCA|nr:MULTISPECIES: ParA family protein [Rhodococcus]QYB00007.1 ParA family protein [Rhodococcus sp. USK10]SEB33074.1 Cellulose biosynthesis protein BcsQ [Rhodococcus koreensis]
MATYAVATLSGSAGKTTTVTSTATLLAQDGYRVRVLDMDSQANASTWLGYPEASGKTAADVLRRNASIKDVERPARVVRGYDEGDQPVYEEIPNLTIVPAARDTLDKLIVELPAVTGGVLHLRDALEEADPVDVTLIDSPGSLNVLVIAGILATTVDEEGPHGSWGLITCTKPSGKENEGIPALEQELRKIKRTYRVDVPLLSIVPCAVPPIGDVYREQMDDLLSEYADRVTPPIRRASIVDEAYTNYVPVPIYGYRAKTVTSDYRAALTHMQKLGLFGQRAVVA